MRSDAPHMRRAREAILAPAARRARNVFTRALLALYGEVPWRAVPAMPVEIMLLPRWFPFHLDKVSYWARTVLVPLLRAAGAAAAGRRIRAASASPELFRRRRTTVAQLAEGRAPEGALGADLRRRSTRC